MKLSHYLEANRITSAHFAELVGHSLGGVRKWRTGERVPRWKHIKRIAEVTNNAVTFHDFVDFPGNLDGKKDEAAA